MGYIKEPVGIDFIIQSPPLTDEDRREFSKFIAESKAKQNALRKRGKKPVLHVASEPKAEYGKKIAQ